MLRSPWSQLCFTFRPALEALGANAGLELFFTDGASSTRMVTSPTRTSFGAFSDFSKNLNLVGFLGAIESSAGGVRGRREGSAFRMSSGSKAGRAARRASCVIEPWRVAVLSERWSSLETISLGLDFACNFRRSSSFLRFSLFSCSSLCDMLDKMTGG